MPIKPENRKRYPANWKDIRKDILKRADNKCEFCGIENYAIRENGSKVVLTIAHLDHTPENCDYSNLRALCQSRQRKLSVPPQFRVVTVYVTIAQTVPSVGITVPGKWTNHVLYAKSVGIMMEKESICGGENVSGTKLLTAMRQREERNSR